MNGYKIGQVFETADFASSAVRARVWGAVSARIAGDVDASGELDELGGRGGGGARGGQSGRDRSVSRDARDCRDESDGEPQFSVLSPEQLDLLCAAGDPSLIGGAHRDL